MIPDYISQDKCTIRFFNCDNMEFMKDIPDKFYDLAIVDPPYGLGENGGNTSRHYSQKKYKVNAWDNEVPNQEYFNELLRISNNQIIFGANHFISKIPYDSPCWIFWDKDRYGDFADGELAWTSFKTAVRYFKWTWDGFRKEEKCNRIHVTEKPIGLYRWLLQKYAKPAQKIYDSHGGSFSHAIACDMEGFDLDICELDKEYFDQALNRFKQYKKQLIIQF